MSESHIEGWLDDRDRPVIRLVLVGLEDPLTVLVDTGFNRQLHIFEDQARQAGLALNPTKTTGATVAGGGKVPLMETTGFVEWMGERREILIHITAGPCPRGEQAKIGTELLRDSRLEVDFGRRIVRIS